jgi:hypothetical protein
LKSATHFIRSVLYSVSVTLIFLLIVYHHTFALTSPSDPLQYVSAALHSEGGFPFPDRVLLWYALRLVFSIGVPAEFVSGVTTILQTGLVLFITTYWLYKRHGCLSATVFSTMFFLGPSWISISSYTYPVQGLTLVLILVAIFVISFGNTESKKATILGSGFILAGFSKIQGAGILIYLVLHSLKVRRRFLFYSWSLLSALTSLSILVVFITQIDNHALATFVTNYVQDGHFKSQLQGRAEGDFPPFHALLLEPTIFLAFLGLLVPVIQKKTGDTPVFALIGLSQLFFLLSIYFFTQRGGPVIANYFLDSITLGLISFSIYIKEATKDKTLALSEYVRNFKFKEGLLLTITAGLYVLCAGFLVSQPGVLYLSNLQGFSSNFWIFLFSGTIFIICCYFIFRHRKTRCWKGNAAITIAIGLVFLVGSRGVSDSKFRAAEANWYHAIAKEISNAHGPKGRLVVYLPSEYDETDVSARISDLLQNFYQGEDVKSFIIVSQRPEGTSHGLLPRKSSLDYDVHRLRFNLEDNQ